MTVKIVANLCKTEGFPCSLAILDASRPADQLRTLETLVAYEEGGKGVVEIHFLSHLSPLLFENVLTQLRPYGEGGRVMLPSLEKAIGCLELLASLFENEPVFPAPLFHAEPDGYSAPGEGLYDPHGFAYAG